MAQQIITTLVDDIDGSEATKTFRFGLDGRVYEIDLNEAHAEDLREILAPYVVAARPGNRKGTVRATSAPNPRAAADLDPRGVRAWATEHGLEVNARGRLKAEIVEQYRAAGN